MFNITITIILVITPNELYIIYVLGFLYIWLNLSFLLRFFRDNNKIGTIIKENVAANFISGPIGLKGSKGKSNTDPVIVQRIPAIRPNIRKHVTQIIETGSKYAKPSGVLGK